MPLAALAALGTAAATAYAAKKASDTNRLNIAATERTNQINQQYNSYQSQRSRLTAAGYNPNLLAPSSDAVQSSAPQSDNTAATILASGIPNLVSSYQGVEAAHLAMDQGAATRAQANLTDMQTISSTIQSAKEMSLNGDDYTANQLLSSLYEKVSRVSNDQLSERSNGFLFFNRQKYKSELNDSQWHIINPNNQDPFLSASRSSGLTVSTALEAYQAYNTVIARHSAAEDTHSYNSSDSDNNAKNVTITKEAAQNVSASLNNVLSRSSTSSNSSAIGSKVAAELNSSIGPLGAKSGFEFNANMSWSKARTLAESINKTISAGQASSDGKSITISLSSTNARSSSTTTQENNQETIRRKILKCTKNGMTKKQILKKYYGQ